MPLFETHKSIEKKNPGYKLNSKTRLVISAILMQKKL